MELSISRVYESASCSTTVGAPRVVRRISMLDVGLAPLAIANASCMAASVREVASIWKVSTMRRSICSS